MAAFYLSQLAQTVETALEKTVVEEFAMNPVLAAIPFTDVTGGGLRYDKEESLPTVGFRNVNGTWTAANGSVTQVYVPTKIAGGELDIDIAAVRRGQSRASLEALKLKALRKNLALKLIKGDAQTTAAEFDGMQVLVTATAGNQLISAGSTAAGDALSLALMDQAKAYVDDSTHWVMGTIMATRFAAAARSSSVGGYVTVVPNQFGQPITYFAGLPILEIGTDSTGTEILGFTEAAATAGATSATSIYCVSLSESGVHMIQNSAPVISDLGEVDSAPKFVTRIEWDVALVTRHTRAASRIYGISNAAITA